MKRCSRLGVFLQVQRALVVVNSLLTEPQRGWCLAENEREKHRQPPVPLRALNKVRGEAWAKESVRGRQRGSEISTSVEKQAHRGEIDGGRRGRGEWQQRGEKTHNHTSPAAAKGIPIFGCGQSSKRDGRSYQDTINTQRQRRHRNTRFRLKPPLDACSVCKQCCPRTKHRPEGQILILFLKNLKIHSTSVL